MICRNMSVFLYSCNGPFLVILVFLLLFVGACFMCIRDGHEVVAEREDGLGRKI